MGRAAVDGTSEIGGEGSNVCVYAKGEGVRGIVDRGDSVGIGAMRVLERGTPCLLKQHTDRGVDQAVNDHQFQSLLQQLQHSVATDIASTTRDQDMRFVGGVLPGWVSEGRP